MSATKPQGELLWGIDLGGTKIEGVIVDAAAPVQPLFRRRVPTLAAEGYERILGQVAKLVEELETESGLLRPEVIGIGTPGNLHPQTGRLAHSNTQCLNGRAFDADLAKALGVEVRMANDANCMALAEATLGAARGRESVFGVILGTGVGGGLVLDGKLHAGRHGTAGEWGQIVLDPQGPLSTYGTRGTIESYIAGPSLEADYRRRTGVSLRLPEIVARQAAGEEAAIAVLEGLRARFAQALSIVINLFDPHAVVIGGGVGNLDLLYDDLTREALRGHLFEKEFTTEILRPELGDSAGVFGAVMLTTTCPSGSSPSRTP